MQRGPCPTRRQARISGRRCVLIWQVHVAGPGQPGDPPRPPGTGPACEVNGKPYTLRAKSFTSPLLREHSLFTLIV